MFKKTLLVKPDITNLLVGNNPRFAYCAADSLYTYDIVENRIIQRLPKTRYSQIALSGDGTLLAAIRPVGLNTEVIFYHIEKQLYEEMRVLISTEISSILPCFSVDNSFLFVCSYDKLWKIACQTGDAECIYQCQQTEMIMSISVNSKGILLSIYNQKEIVRESFMLMIDYNGNVMWKCGLLAINAFSDLHSFCCKWLSNDSFIFLQERAGWRSHIQIFTLPFSKHLITNTVSLDLSFSITENCVSASYDQQYFVLGGTEYCDGRIQNTVMLFHIPTFKEVYTEHFDFLWTIQFFLTRPTLIICSNKQYFIDL